MVLYPEEDPSHLFALNKLETCGYSYCAIDHDKDIYDSYDNCDVLKIGQPKKKHTHIYLRLKSPRYAEPLAEELGIAPNYLQVCRDSKGTLLYMIHDGFPNKYQYDLDSVYGPLRFELAKLLVSDDEGSRVLQILDLIDSMPTPCTYRQLLIAVCNNGLYGDFRRMGIGVKTLLEEHNCPGGIF